jgi:DNA-binding MarR family transcriptional regulator
MRFPSHCRPIPKAAQIRILAMLLTKITERDLEQRLAELGVPLSVSQLSAMRAIYHNPGHTQSELSRHMMLAPATLVPLIDALERHGMARRTRDEHDRRRALVSLTEAGAALLDEFPALHNETAMARAIEAMGQDKAQQLIELLRELIEHVAGDDPLARHMLARLHEHGMTNNQVHSE